MARRRRVTYRTKDGRVTFLKEKSNKSIEGYTAVGRDPTKDRPCPDCGSHMTRKPLDNTKGILHCDFCSHKEPYLEI